MAMKKNKVHFSPGFCPACANNLRTQHLASLRRTLKKPAKAGV